MGGRTGRVLVGPGRPYDLIAVCLLAIGAVLLSIYFHDSRLTWALGFLAIFFTPGYAIVSALFPGKKEILAQSFIVRREERAFTISMIERLSVSVGLSVAAMALVGTLLTRGLTDLTLASVSAEVLTLTLFFSGVAIYRRSKLPPGDQFSIVTKSKATKRRFTKSEKGVAAAIVVSLFIFAGVAINGLNAKPSQDRFSEFSITGADGDLQHLPSVLSAGQQGLVTVTVVSHLGQSANMTLILSLENTTSRTSAFDPGLPVTMAPNAPRSTVFTLEDGQTWKKVITFSIPSAGKYTLFLTLNDGKEVKQLWMPLTVA